MRLVWALPLAALIHLSNWISPIDAKLSPTIELRPDQCPVIPEVPLFTFLEKCPSQEPPPGYFLPKVHVDALSDDLQTASSTSKSDDATTQGSAVGEQSPSAQQSSDSDAPATGSASAIPASSGQVEKEIESETDSPLDAPHFLSFEDWRKENLEKSGQSGSHIDSRRPELGSARKRPGANINALDSLGEDSEIDIDFVGFGPAPRPQEIVTATQQSNLDPEHSGTEGGLIRGRLRPRDAGSTCKERFNYASFDCAANILKSNPKCKSSSSLLVESKDSYMRNECQTKNKFFIVELCDLIFVDTIVMANYEFFSSTFRAFTISASDRYPVKAEGWKKLGSFEARNTRDVQAFLVEDPMIWARYIRVELRTHYGVEYYCPVSLFRVHGTTMVEEFRRENEAMIGDGILEEEAAPVAEIIPIIAPLPEVDVIKPTPEIIQSSTETLIIPSPTVLTESLLEQLVQPTSSQPPPDLAMFRVEPLTCSPNEKLGASDHGPTRSVSEAETPLDRVPISGSNSHVPISAAVQKDHPEAEATASTPPPPEAPSATLTPEESGATIQAEGIISTTPKKMAEKPVIVRPPIIYPPIPPGQMGTQESFFKTIHRRLQQLEANATLSLQYIEEQSRLLRDAFTKVEKRQMNKTTRFLDGLNDTVVRELSEFRSQYTHLWLTAISELESQREFSKTEIAAISARLAVLADEVIVQKRWAIVQSSLVILAIMVSLFARSSDGQLLRSMLTRSRSRLPIDSPMNGSSRRSHRLPMHDLRDRIMSSWSDRGHRRHDSAPELLTHNDVEDQSSASEDDRQVIRQHPKTGLTTPDSEIIETWSGGLQSEEAPIMSKLGTARPAQASYLHPNTFDKNATNIKQRLGGSPLRFAELASDQGGQSPPAGSPNGIRNAGWSSFDPADGYFTPRDFYPTPAMQSEDSGDSQETKEEGVDEYGEPGSSDPEDNPGIDRHDSPEPISPIVRPRSAYL